MPLRALISDALVVCSLIFARIAVWQEQVEWGLRVAAGIVAIAAGAVAIWQKLRRPSPKSESSERSELSE